MSQEGDAEQEIYFIQHETDYGPFFSSREKAVTFLKKDMLSPNASPELRRQEEEELEKAIAGKSCYTNLVPVTLDDESVSFDG
jgi:hypothetical protein